MLNYRMLALIKRELREKLMSKGFIIMTILLPVLMFGIIGIQTYLISYEGNENVKIKIITESVQLTNNLAKEFRDAEFVKDSSYTITYQSIPEIDFEEYLKSIKSTITEDKLTGVIFIPNSALKDKEIKYYSKIPKNFTVTERLSRPINKVLVESFFKDKQLSGEEIRYARESVDVKGFKVTKDEKIIEEGFGNLVLSYVFTFLLYISLLMMGQMTMQSVQEEKNNRIVEVLLSSVSSKELMTGKILGSAIIGLLQMAIWMMPIVAVISTTWFALPPELTFDVSLFSIGYFLLNFFIGLITFLGLFATVGAIFENAQEAQSGMWPVMLLIIIPFFISISLMKNPTNPIAQIASMLPFASIIVMPAKVTLIEVPIWQLITSFAVNIATILLIFPIAGKIYRVGILRTGKKPKWSDVIRWLKYKY